MFPSPRPPTTKMMMTSRAGLRSPAGLAESTAQGRGRRNKAEVGLLAEHLALLVGYRGAPGRHLHSSVQRVSEMIPTNPGALRDTARDDEHTEHAGSGLHASDRDTIEEHSSGEPGNRMAGRGGDAACNVVPRVLAASTALVAGSDVLATGKDVLATENGVLATGKDVLATRGEVALVARSDAQRLGSEVQATGRSEEGSKVTAMPSSKIWFSPQLQPKSCAAPSLAVSCDVVVLDEMQRSPSADQFTQIRGDAVAWSPLRLSMDELMGGSQPAGVAAPTAQDAEQTVVHATPLWSKAAGPLEQVHWNSQETSVSRSCPGSGDRAALINGCRWGRRF